jgi:hypothetical protein
MEGTNIPQAPRTVTVRQASPEPTGTTFAQAVLNAVWPWLHNRRAMMILAAIVLTVGGLALGWNWLVAIGVAPILIAALPCVVMCAVGLCAMKGSQSCSTSDGEVRPSVSASADSARRVAMDPGDISHAGADGPEPQGAASNPNPKREESS